MDQDPPDPEPEPERYSFRRNVPRGMKTWCHDCEGRGAKLIPRMGVIDGSPAPTAQMQQCRTCEGSGRLEGFEPPV